MITQHMITISYLSFLGDCKMVSDIRELMLTLILSKAQSSSASY